MFYFLQTLLIPVLTTASTGITGSNDAIYNDVGTHLGMLSTFVQTLRFLSTLAATILSLSLFRFLDIHSVAANWAGPPDSYIELKSLFMNDESLTIHLIG